MRWVQRLQTAASSVRPSASSCIGEPHCLRCLQRLPHIGRAASPTRSRFSAPGFPPRSLFAASSCTGEEKTSSLLHALKQIPVTLDSPIDKAFHAVVNRKNKRAPLFFAVRKWKAEALTDIGGY